MDPFSKKRKAEENGAATASPAGGAAALGLTRDDVLRLLEPLSGDLLADVVEAAAKGDEDAKANSSGSG